MALLLDGFSTTISLTSDTTIMGIVLLEKTVTPPAVDAGGKHDISTMRNAFVRTFHPKKLYTLDDLTLTVAYQSEAYNSVLFVPLHGNINLNQVINITFPDAHIFSFWGFVDKFKPNPHKEGEQPTAEIVICPTLHNNASPPGEVAPTWA